MDHSNDITLMSQWAAEGFDTYPVDTSVSSGSNKTKDFVSECYLPEVLTRKIRYQPEIIVVWCRMNRLCDVRSKEQVASILRRFRFSDNCKVKRISQACSFVRSDDDTSKQMNFDYD
ncbi:hypothetical protein NPIL_349321 [Nephila pilipes]|uniref:Uncharacterized protein n=1 Tax=Nephila pilipes TaxID=299642 RepID=A0A8X6UTR1_NEPPI|nr:hypothetical protein NPIL_349321 [Nephila pilipes]